jgi:hypothetical protein
VNDRQLPVPPVLSLGEQTCTFATTVLNKTFSTGPIPCVETDWTREILMPLWQEVSDRRYRMGPLWPLGEIPSYSRYAWFGSSVFHNDFSARPYGLSCLEVCFRFSRRSPWYWFGHCCISILSDAIGVLARRICIDVANQNRLTRRTPNQVTTISA